MNAHGHGPPLQVWTELHERIDVGDAAQLTQNPPSN